jgi:tetratricopeptide (TPR) repeat protein
MREQLQATLGAAYTLERELGGGGMSRVFLAEETALRRKVVVKVLPHELTAGVNVERFNREILLAAKLQHPHIVPVLAAGETDGLPYYTMPFVEGESLRARLARDGALPLNEAVGYLRDVAKALAYAHDHGIVHRDIKPDNVLITGDAATVTDFGIAKAISASRTSDSNAALTQVGTSIGTPSYMSPEQAAGDPGTDHRADIYSFGCVAYELLTGHPPFTELSPRKLLAAHMGQIPRPVTELRVDTPPALADLIMRCLAKSEDDRPQNAHELVHALGDVSSAGGHPAMPMLLFGGVATFRRALGLYTIAFGVVALLAKAAIVGIGLPDWVLPGASLIMALGFPVVLFTGYVQKIVHRNATATPTFTPGGTPSMTHGTMATMALKAAPHVSWHRTSRGMSYAIGAFVALIAVVMVLRQFGIGPAASLFGAGKLKRNEPMVLADFTVKGGADSSLASAVAEAVRADLGQSNAIQLVPTSVISATLKLMQRPATSRLDVALAREVAQRAGSRAVITGDLTPLGAGFIVGLRLVSADQGDVLASFQATADGPAQLIPTVQKVTRDMRSRIGESLRNVQASAPLEQVTTASLEALKKYDEGVREVNAGRNTQAVAAFRDAIAIDSAFAMAWRRLGVSYLNGAYTLALAVPAVDQAYRYRDRLSENERLLATAYYYQSGSHRDRPRAIANYEALQQKGLWGPHSHNLAMLYSERRQYAQAESLYRAYIATGAAPSSSNSNLVGLLYAEGAVAAGDSVATELRRRFPDNGVIILYPGNVAWFRGNVDSARAAFERVSKLPNARLSSTALVNLGQVEAATGRVTAALRDQTEGRRLLATGGTPFDSLAWRLDMARGEIWWREHPEQGVRMLDEALAKNPLKSRYPFDGLYHTSATLYAQAGRPDKARAVLAQFDADNRDSSFREYFAPYIHGARADIALAEKRPREAIAEFRLADQRPDGPAALVPRLRQFAGIGRAFDLDNQPDSAIAYFERYLVQPVNFRLPEDAVSRAGIEKRLGELYDARGNAPKAVEHYRAFVELWKNADPELQPKVAVVRERLKALAPTERPRR